MKNTLIILTLCCVLTIACKKKDDTTTSQTTPTNTTTPSKSFVKLVFCDTVAYFSTDGSMSAPVDSNKAKTLASKIDITFIYNNDYSEPGFFDPIARSQVWYWNDYHESWLSTAVETRYYTTKLTKAQYDAAAADQSKIATYFADTSVKLAPHAIFPTGSCIGGRVSYSPNSVSLGSGTVFGFKNTVSGKRGLLYIRTDQPSGWPYNFIDIHTYVDIVREN